MKATAQVYDLLDENPVAAAYLLTFGPASGSGGANAFVDDDRFGALANDDNGKTRLVTDAGKSIANVAGDRPGSYIVSGRANPIAGYQHCTSCDFIDWGWWGTRVRVAADGTEIPDARSDYVHMGTWVAGDITNPADLPNNISATYSGTALGNVARQTSNGVAKYIARGDMDMSYDFNSRSGTLQISNFDGMTVSGVDRRQLHRQSGAVPRPAAGQRRDRRRAGRLRQQWPQHRGRRHRRLRVRQGRLPRRGHGRRPAELTAVRLRRRRRGMPAFAQPIFRFLRKRRFLAIWFCGALAVAAVIVLAFSPLSPLDRLNALVFDAYQNLQPRPAAESPVVVVDIDDESIRKFGQWPWPRTFLAEYDRPAGRDGRGVDRPRHPVLGAGPHVAGFGAGTAARPGLPDRRAGNQPLAGQRPGVCRKLRARSGRQRAGARRFGSHAAAGPQSRIFIRRHRSAGISGRLPGQRPQSRAARRGRFRRRRHQLPAWPRRHRPRNPAGLEVRQQALSRFVAGIAARRARRFDIPDPQHRRAWRAGYGLARHGRRQGSETTRSRPGRKARCGSTMRASRPRPCFRSFA